MSVRDYPEFEIYVSAKKRCYNKNCRAFKNYGGRGILFSEDWKKSFYNFYRDIGARPTNKHTLDRIDNDKGYSKENCRWVTRDIQSMNSRMQKNNTTGYRGVHFNKKLNKFTAFTRIQHVSHFIGVFATAELAYDAYLKFNLENRKYQDGSSYSLPK